MSSLTDIDAAYTEAQAQALRQARLYIIEDGDSAGIRVVTGDHKIKLDQLTPDGYYVRTWIASHDGHLTWIS